jgi:peptidylprolyl isomerase
MQKFMWALVLAFLSASMEFCSQAPGELKSTDQVIGKGDMAVKGATVEVYYTGWLYTNGRRGRKFDSSVDKPFPFKLGGGEVIEGWDRGVEGMRVGGKRELIIPPQLGYGAHGSPPDIPPNATLDFEIQLVSVTK